MAQINVSRDATFRMRIIESAVWKNVFCPSARMERVICWPSWLADWEGNSTGSVWLGRRFRATWFLSTRKKRPSFTEIRVDQIARKWDSDNLLRILDRLTSGTVSTNTISRRHFADAPVETITIRSKNVGVESVPGVFNKGRRKWERHNDRTWGVLLIHRVLNTWFGHHGSWCPLGESRLRCF